jgi:hypothetical protein
VSDAPAERKPRLFGQLRQAFRSRHYCRRIEQAYATGVKRFIYFRTFRHPVETGVFMPIRIRRHGKSWHGTEVAETKGIIAALADR